jgi:hypothetical protein
VNVLHSGDLFGPAARFSAAPNTPMYKKIGADLRAHASHRMAHAFKAMAVNRFHRIRPAVFRLPEA